MIVGGAAAIQIRAQVQLPGVNLGDTNFEDGFAGPGFLLEEFPDVYSASTLKDQNGVTVSGSNTLTTISTTSHVAYVSSKKVLGAWIGAEVLIPVVDVELRLAGGTNTIVRGVADPVIGPLALQWPPKRIRGGILVQRAILDLTAPVGKYSSHRSVNIGNNFVTINPYYALTYEMKKMEFSARFHYLWNSTNSDPFVGLHVNKIQPGQAFHSNFATSYEARRFIRIGFNSYWLQQLTNHQINGVDAPDSKERAVGIGPGIQVGGNGLWLRVNGYVETDVRSRMCGTKVTFRISKTLGKEAKQ